MATKPAQKITEEALYTREKDKYIHMFARKKNKQMRIRKVSGLKYLWP